MESARGFTMNEHIKVLLASGLHLPGVEESFDVLVGNLQPPPDIDKASYLHVCQAVLEDAIDQVEIRLTGKPVFWPTPRLGNTNIPHPDTPNNQIPYPEERLETNTLQSEFSDRQT